MLSFHAQQRMQQRGITQRVIDAILRYGDECYSNRAMSYFHSKTSKALMLADGYSPSFVERCQGIYVICQESLIITVCHAKRKK